MILDGCLVLAMMIAQAVRRQVAMYHELCVSVVFTFMDMLGRGNRQQADSQAEHACDNSGHPHRCIVCDVGLAHQMSGLC